MTPKNQVYIAKDVSLQTISHLASEIHTFFKLLCRNCFWNPDLFAAQVYKRLKLTLELVKKEMEISKIQVLDAIFYVLLI